MKSTITILGQAEISCVIGGSKELFPIPRPACDLKDPGCQEKFDAYKKLSMQWACHNDGQGVLKATASAELLDGRS